MSGSPPFRKLETTKQDRRRSMSDLVDEMFEGDIVPVDELVDMSQLTMPDIIPKKPMTVSERYVAELYSLGESPKAIASKTGLPHTTVKTIINKPHIKEFVTELVNAQYNVMKEGRLRLLNKIIDDKLEKLEEEYGGDLSNATKKDLVDLLVIMDGMLKEKEKAELGTGSDTYVNIIQQVIKD
jgi:hypothetical protein